MGAVSQDALDQLFIEARTHNGWSETPVPVEMLKKIWDLTKCVQFSRTYALERQFGRFIENRVAASQSSTRYR